MYDFQSDRPSVADVNFVQVEVKMDENSVDILSIKRPLLCGVRIYTSYKSIFLFIHEI